MSSLEKVQEWLDDGTLRRVSPIYLHYGVLVYDAELFARRALHTSSQDQWVGYAARNRLKELVVAVERAIEYEKAENEQDKARKGNAT